MSTTQLELPPKLIPVFQGDYRYRGAYGGRGSGKTRTFAMMTAVKAYQFAEAGRVGQILCAREFLNSLDDSSFQEVKTAIQSVPWLNDYFDCGDRYIRTKNKKVYYTFAGLRNNIDSIKSKSRILLCWLDEADPVSDDAYVKLIPTVREADSEIWVTWNPERKNSPTDLRFKQNPDDDMNIVELNWRDNPWFPAVLEKERQRDKKNKPELYEHIWEGGYLDYVHGSILSTQLNKAKEEDRITKIPIVDSVPVWGFFDIGNSDGTAIWLCQRVGMELRLIDFIEGWGEPYSHYVKLLKAKEYNYEAMFLPHDAGHERQGQHHNKSPKQMLEELMPSVSWEVVPRVTDIWTGINQLRDLFSQLYFDADRCEKGLDHLYAYRRKWSENEKRWLDKPDKSEGHSEAADALRQLAQAHANNQLDMNTGGELNYNFGYLS